MNTEVSQPQNFEQRMKDRIKDSIGDLISDEELSALVHRGLEEVFFTARTVKVGWNDTKTMPPLLHEIVKESLGENVRKAVDEWVKAHPEELQKVIVDVIQQGMGAALLAAITSKFQSDLFLLQSNLMNSLQR